MVLQTIAQLYFASLRQYSRQFDEITIIDYYVIDSFEFNFQKDYGFLMIQHRHKLGANMHRK